jgi:hypothetical protein
MMNYIEWFVMVCPNMDTPNPSIYNGFIMWDPMFYHGIFIHFRHRWPIAKRHLRAPAFLNFCQTFTQCAQQRTVAIGGWAWQWTWSFQDI